MYIHKVHISIHVHIFYNFLADKSSMTFEFLLSSSISYFEKKKAPQKEIELDRRLRIGLCNAILADLTYMNRSLARYSGHPVYDVKFTKGKE